MGFKKDKIIFILVAFVPSVVCLWILLDLLFFPYQQWPYPDGGDHYYEFLADSWFWHQWIAHCHFFMLKIYTFVILQLSWLLGVALIPFQTLAAQDGQESSEDELFKHKVTQIGLWTYLGILVVERLVYIFRTESFVSTSGALMWLNILFLLILSLIIATVPQWYFLKQIWKRFLTPSSSQTAGTLESKSNSQRIFHRITQVIIIASFIGAIWAFVIHFMCG